MKVQPPLGAVSLSKRTVFLTKEKLVPEELACASAELSAPTLIDFPTVLSEATTNDLPAVLSDTSSDKVPEKPKSAQSDSKPSSAQVTHSDPLVLKLIQENEMLQQQVKELKGQFNLPRRSEGNKENFNLNPDQVAAFKLGTTRGRKWLPETVQKGLKLRYSCGSSGYQQVIKNVVPLPSVRTLQRKTEHLKFQPGILVEVLDAFEVELVDFSDLDKDCSIFWDEMALTSCVELDRSTGCYIGTVTLPNVTGVAYKALVFMFGGIHRKWKLTVAYYFVPKETYAEAVKDIVIDLLGRAKGIGLNVKCLVCDMGNRGIMNALGFSLKKDNIVFKIQNPADPENSLYCLPDMVHVFKSVKEMLCNNRIITLPHEVVDRCNLPSNIVDVGHIEMLSEYQEDVDLKIAPRLKARNIHANHFDKMKVGTSTNVLNDKTGVGLCLLVAENVVPTEFSTTAFFCQLMTKWFSYVTSRTRELALSLHNREAFDQAIGVIRLVRDVFLGMKVGTGESWKPAQTHVVLACEVVLSLVEDLLLSGRYDFVMLGRFLQDLIENLFSLVRMQTPNPTPLQFKNRLKQITLSQFMEKISNASYHHDDRVDGVDMLLQPKPKPETQIPAIPDGLLSWTCPPEQTTSKKIIEENVLYRMCGYVLSRLINRNSIKCEKCISALQRDIPHERSSFTQMTNYKENAQYEVTDEVFQVCRLVEHNLISWKPVLKEEVKVPVSYLCSNFIFPALSSVNFSTCHDVKSKFVTAFVEMRMRQFSGKASSEKGAKDPIALSSKSTGCWPTTTLRRHGKPSLLQ